VVEILCEHNSKGNEWNSKVDPIIYMV